MRILYPREINKLIPFSGFLYRESFLRKLVTFSRVNFTWRRTLHLASTSQN